MPHHPAVCAATHARDPDRPRSAAPGAYLCHGCIAGMTRHLEQLPGLHDDVVQAMPTGRGGLGPAVRGTRTPGLPVNLDAAEVASQIVHDTGYLARLVAAERGLDWSDDGGVAARCALLLRHVDWLACSRWAAEVRALLAEDVREAFRVLSPGRRPIVLGPCPRDCDGTIRAEVTPMGVARPSRITCDACPLEVEMRDWFAFGAGQAPAA